eukprot:Rmarinus@m.16517
MSYAEVSRHTSRRPSALSSVFEGNTSDLVEPGGGTASLRLSPKPADLSSHYGGGGGDSVLEGSGLDDGGTMLDAESMPDLEAFDAFAFNEDDMKVCISGLVNIFQGLVSHYNSQIWTRLRIAQKQHGGPQATLTDLENLVEGRPLEGTRSAIRHVDLGGLEPLSVQSAGGGAKPGSELNLLNTAPEIKVDTSSAETSVHEVLQRFSWEFSQKFRTLHTAAFTLRKKVAVFEKRDRRQRQVIHDLQLTCEDIQEASRKTQLQMDIMRGQVDRRDATLAAMRDDYLREVQILRDRVTAFEKGSAHLSTEKDEASGATPGASVARGLGLSSFASVPPRPKQGSVADLKLKEESSFDATPLAVATPATSARDSVEKLSVRLFNPQNASPDHEMQVDELQKKIEDLQKKVQVYESVVQREKDAQNRTKIQLEAERADSKQQLLERDHYWRGKMRRQVDENDKRIEGLQRAATLMGEGDINPKLKALKEDFEAEKRQLQRKFQEQAHKEIQNCETKFSEQIDEMRANATKLTQKITFQQNENTKLQEELQATQDQLESTLQEMALLSNTNTSRVIDGLNKKVSELSSNVVGKDKIIADLRESLSAKAGSASLSEEVQRMSVEIERKELEISTLKSAMSETESMLQKRIQVLEDELESRDVALPEMEINVSSVTKVGECTSDPNEAISVKAGEAATETIVKKEVERRMKMYASSLRQETQQTIVQLQQSADSARSRLQEVADENVKLKEKVEVTKSSLDQEREEKAKTQLQVDELSSSTKTLEQRLKKSLQELTAKRKEIENLHFSYKIRRDEGAKTPAELAAEYEATQNATGAGSGENVEGSPDSTPDIDITIDMPPVETSEASVQTTLSGPVREDVMFSRLKRSSPSRIFRSRKSVTAAQSGLPPESGETATIPEKSGETSTVTDGEAGSTDTKQPGDVGEGGDAKEGPSTGEEDKGGGGAEGARE